MSKNSIKKDNSILTIIIVLFVLYFVANIVFAAIGIIGSVVVESFRPNTFTILSSYENQSVEDEVVRYAKKKKIKVKFEYMGDLEIVDELNNNSSKYDAVWISNSMWLYMLDNPYLTTNSKSISVSPVVFGVKKDKATELDLVSNENITNDTIINLIREKKIKYVMSSVTRTNTGATAYLGFLESLAGNPEMLTEEMIYDENIKDNLIDLFSGVERVSGNDNYLEEMFLNSDDYEAVIAAESSIININNNLIKNNKEPLYLIYPKDGVAINDSTFGFIPNDSNDEEDFLEIQRYLLSREGQKMLEKNGVRTWYGGVNKKPNKDVFDKSWGIDTTKYLNVTRFPSKKVITAALNYYVELLRKPTHVVFCLDYSGSMYGERLTDLKSAMDYILDKEKASKDMLQFSEKDKVTIVPFSTDVIDVWDSKDVGTHYELMKSVNSLSPNGSTALYAAIKEGLDILENESDDYTKTIIAMTDGAINVGTFEDLENAYKRKKSKVPIYSITFGDADLRQLNKIADLSNAKVFDGRTDLLKAFKEVRGYN